MHRVVEHIDRHLDEPLELEALARVANFSAFHFHRLFAAWMGETLGAYLRRRRLEVAASRIVTQPALPITQVALAVGFGSNEAFARAFKSRFGLSPSAWRAAERERRLGNLGRLNSNLDQSPSKPDQAAAGLGAKHGASGNLVQEAAMQVKLIDRQPVTVAYLRYVGPPGKPVSDFWMNTVYPWMVTNDLIGRPRYGISPDDPGITAPEKWRYDACVEVPQGFTGAGRHLETTIPGGKYATARFKGTGAEIGGAWESLLRDWLPDSGMQLDSRPIFEYYPSDARYESETGIFECDICIPVTAL